MIDPSPKSSTNLFRLQYLFYIAVFVLLIWRNFSILSSEEFLLAKMMQNENDQVPIAESSELIKTLLQLRPDSNLYQQLYSDFYNFDRKVEYKNNQSPIQNSMGLILSHEQIADFSQFNFFKWQQSIDHLIQESSKFISPIDAQLLAQFLQERLFYKESLALYKTLYVLFPLNSDLKSSLIRLKVLNNYRNLSPLIPSEDYSLYLWLKLREHPQQFLLNYQVHLQEYIKSTQNSEIQLFFDLYPLIIQQKPLWISQLFQEVKSQWCQSRLLLISQKITQQIEHSSAQNLLHREYQSALFFSNKQYHQANQSFEDFPEKTIDFDLHYPRSKYCALLKKEADKNFQKKPKLALNALLKIKQICPLSKNRFQDLLHLSSLQESK